MVIADERHPRGIWLKGRVEEVVLGEDKVVRSAKVRTKIGVLHRPSRKLIVLDIFKDKL